MEIPPVQKKLRIGTRKSNLAIVQAEGIRDKLQRLAPERSFEIQALHTLGDKNKTTALYNFDAKSLWTAELESLLTSGELDVIVHYMPTRLPDSCCLAAIPPRDDPRDALIVKAGLPFTTLKELPEGSVVGTSSVRRIAQLRRLYPHLRFANLRGNVETRLAKVDNPESEYSCMVMSAAGLERIGLSRRISQYLGSKDGGILHAVGQGALGLEIRKGDNETLSFLNQLGDKRSTLAGLAERALMRELEGGCSVPIGVETEWLDPSQDMLLRMRAIVVSLDGSQSVEDTIDITVRTEDEANALGEALAARLVKAGASAILEDINARRPEKD
ncbi:porphobilinogen deaminase Hem3, putative [Paecilomyces variotii No. 5]|uniref:Porphobilinogen deaminase n=1 Tax=Byssochlamys spectabilis (strain No. 5 / NBRC 109023) TaxID=1356009 RepID=V5G0B1_BYSSN|nr:porphobilinogen deaminase Hem3, putative [Paecilomyces variotii No. 5]